MDQTHIHLMVTHLPIFGSLMGIIVIAYGLYAKSVSTQIAAYIVFIVSGIGAAISYLTGEAAEETVEDIAGISKDLIEEHEEFALLAFIALIILGAVSLISLILTIRKSGITRRLALITFLISLLSFGMMAYTGYLGGQIRHTEINK